MEEVGQSLSILSAVVEEDLRMTEHSQKGSQTTAGIQSAATTIEDQQKGYQSADC